jgi:hypothetical protein
MVWSVRVDQIGGDEEKLQSVGAGDGTERIADAVNRMSRYFVATPTL